MTIIDYPFTEEEAKAAYEEWHCNCGPTALAFACRLKLDDVRHAIPGFEAKHYTSPSMMKAALTNLGRRWEPAAAVRRPCGWTAAMFYKYMALVRIQWAGPWTAPDANPKWAYRQTHWIATWEDEGRNWLFDCNGGIMRPSRWESEIVPLLTACYPRADGGWFPTHIWRLT